jgi:hypothetical protein
MYVNFLLSKNWLDVLLVYEGIAIVIQMYVQVPLKPKNMFLCNTLIIKKSLFHS